MKSLLIALPLILASISFPAFAGDCNATITKAIEGLALTNGRNDKVVEIEQLESSTIMGMPIDNYYVSTTGAPYKVKATKDGVKKGQCEVLGLGYTIILD
jgi:hypothetical protein